MKLQIKRLQIGYSKRHLTSASNLTPQAVRFFAKKNDAKTRPTCSAIYAGVMCFSGLGVYGYQSQTNSL